MKHVTNEKLSLIQKMGFNFFSDGCLAAHIV